MNVERLGVAAIAILFVVLFGLFAQVSAAPTHDPLPTPATPSGPIASPEQLQTARAEWEQSAHADTFDNGMGANTTCAHCKSPRNWDPTQDLPAQNALDCASCKRIPGEERPVLSGGVEVAESDWLNIQCDICHIPVGDSYYTTVSFWNQALGLYETVDSVSELCAHCHEGSHGFMVVEEQEATDVHAGMECTDCHGNHGLPASCTDCHDPMETSGAQEHALHPNVDCSGCHDGGGLSIWLDSDPNSRHYGQYITRRFAHTLTSWPSHNLTTEVNCKRCHHPTRLRDQSSAVVPGLECRACHEVHPYGAVSFWCTYLSRDENPWVTAPGAPESK